MAEPDDRSSFLFDHLTMISTLECLQSESEVGSHRLENSLISIGDKYFYPIQARCEMVDAFQQIVKREWSRLKEMSGVAIILCQI